MKKPLHLRAKEWLMALLLLTAFFSANAQERCGSMELLQQKFRQHPALKDRFLTREKVLKQLTAERIQTGDLHTLKPQALLTVPVIFHIVMANPASVTDAQIQAQMDTLNKDYSGTNGDTVRIPAAFKPLFGVANIQFALAKQTPNGEPSSGIERYTTSHGEFSVFTTDAKHASSGGADAWNTTNYLNIWICQLSGGYLGLGTFPDDNDSANQGLLIDYRALPGGSFPNYNGGKTISHEVGHFFNLYHIWGDDNGACSGTDYVGDTPNQSNYTSGCPSGVVTDACTTTAPGVMYQNYMDYSYDPCLVMFTMEQAARMQSAVNTYRPGLFTSPGLQTPVTFPYDTRLKTINSPSGRICSSSYAPVVVVRNVGSSTIASLTINVAVDGTFVTSYNWSGSLAPLGETTITISSITALAGTHSVKIYTTNPGGQADQRTGNDTLTTSYIYSAPVSLPITESFEGSVFPPSGWDIVNPDASYTWEKA
ncbi:MAG: hypothetical protein JST39_15045, partial [Bacteroidetes bacterium]|nr:hypothetical protein [Bacteroidota bacterium]